MENIDRRREELRIYQSNYRSTSQGLPSTLTIEQWLDILKKYEYNCIYCKAPYQELEHLIPHTKGGGTTKDNCFPVYRTCNMIKYNYFLPLGYESKTIEQLIQEISIYIKSKEIDVEYRPKKSQKSDNGVHLHNVHLYNVPIELIDWYADLAEKERRSTSAEIISILMQFKAKYSRS